MSQIIKNKINLILDTDTYNECDDQFALSYLIKSKDLFNIEAITVAPYSHTKRDVTVRDGQELSYNEILKICNWLNFDTDNRCLKVQWINKNWFETEQISCPNIRKDTSYEVSDYRHNITLVTKLNRNKIYDDLFKKLGE